MRPNEKPGRTYDELSLLWISLLLNGMPREGMDPVLERRVVSSCRTMPSRNEVYAAVDGEREYQEYVLELFLTQEAHFD